jgi:hypothetical protein
MRTLILALMLPVAANASTTVNVNSMNMDDLAIRDVHCELSSGGLFASMAVAAQLASQADAFNACHPAGAAIRLSWTWQGEQLVNPSVTSSSVSGVNSCMITALGAIRSPLSGTCQTTFLVGDDAAAEAAYAASIVTSAPAATPVVPTTPAPGGKAPMGEQPAPSPPSGK